MVFGQLSLIINVASHNSNKIKYSKTQCTAVTEIGTILTSTDPARQSLSAQFVRSEPTSLQKMLCVPSQQLSPLLPRVLYVGFTCPCVVLNNPVGNLGILLTHFQHGREIQVLDHTKSIASSRRRAEYFAHTLSSSWRLRTTQHANL